MRKLRVPPGPMALVVVSLVAAVASTVSSSARQSTPPPAAAQPPAAGQADRQFPPLTFKVEVNYVEVDAIVTDPQGRFVGDLKQDDFQVLEDGRPQSLVSFGVVNVPVEYADAPLFVSQPIEPDVTSNARPFDGRIYLIVLDDLHIDALWSPRVRASAKRLVQQMGANDVAAVVTTGGTADGSQEFTSNKRLLLAAIDKFMGKSLRSATLNKLDDYNRNRANPIGGSFTPRDMDEHQRAYYARNTLEALRNVSELMAGVRGRRKALVFFSEGISYDVLDVFNNQYASDIRSATQDAIAAATRSNVSIYSVDPRGLVDVDTMGLSGVDPAMDPALRLDVNGLRDELRNQQDSLKVLAEETGGFAAINSNDYSNAFNRMRDENSNYYLLGYYATNDRRDGRFRKIEVRVGRSGLTVRARKGYVAPRNKLAAAAPTGKDSPSPPLREAMDSPLPLSGLRLSVFAAPFKGTAPNASVAVVLKADGSGLKFVERDGRFVGNMEVSIVAVDHNGKIRNATRQKVDMPLRPQSRTVVEREGIRVVSRIEIPPGKYQLRVAALDGNSQLAGSVYYDLEVPDFVDGPLSMSGVVITSTSSGLGPVVGLAADDAMRQMLPGPPTLVRQFQPSEELGLMTEVYDNEGKTPHKVTIATTLRADDGREVFRIADERSSSEFQGARGGYGYTARVPLKGLAPGLYVLKVEARSTLGKNTTTAREVQIRVAR
jgi:VWFA-related protein